MLDLRAFQKKFIREALAPDIDTACCSIPRGNGKSFLAAHILTRVLDPDDVLFRPGTESVLGAASTEQARVVFRFVRADLEQKPGYRFLDSHTRIGVTHVPTNTKLRIISSNAKTAMGLVNTPYAVLDEPGSYEVVGGHLMHDAIQTAQGKPGSPLKAIYIGTLAPSRDGWWHRLIADGSRGSSYVQALQGDPARWDQWPEIRRCNPLTAISAPFRRKLLEERDAARRDSRLKARFMSYRLNVPSADESTVLLTVDDWQRVLARPVPDREGQRRSSALILEVVGPSAPGFAMFHNGRVEALAIAPGIPDIEDQERRDRVPKGVYRRLVDQGSLRIAHGLRVPPPSILVDAIRQWSPRFIVADRFELNRLKDAARGIRVEPSVTRWSEATADIVALRSMAADGPLAVDPASTLLIEASLAASMVKNDDQGSTRIVKRDPANNTGRDDVAVALTLAAGAISRTPAQPTVWYLGRVSAEAAP